MSVAVVTDSTAYLPTGLVADLDIEVVPLYVVLTGRSGREGLDVGSAEVARTLRRCNAPVLTLRTDRDWIADLVRFVASRRRGALAGQQ